MIFFPSKQEKRYYAFWELYKVYLLFANQFYYANMLGIFDIDLCSKDMP